MLRSPLLFENANEEGYLSDLSYNIDIEFGGVAYLDLPDIFQGILLREVTADRPEKFNKYLASSGYKVFEIKSEGESYYIVAGSYKIGKCKWLTENRVSSPTLEYDEILNVSYPAGAGL